jgi:hypothetical protein
VFERAGAFRRPVDVPHPGHGAASKPDAGVPDQQ